MRCDGQGMSAVGGVACGGYRCRGWACRAGRMGESGAGARGGRVTGCGEGSLGRAKSVGTGRCDEACRLRPGWRWGVMAQACLVARVGPIRSERSVARLGESVRTGAHRVVGWGAEQTRNRHVDRAVPESRGLSALVGGVRGGKDLSWGVPEGWVGQVSLSNGGGMSRGALRPGGLGFVVGAWGAGVCRWEHRGPHCRAGCHGRACRGPGGGASLGAAARTAQSSGLDKIGLSVGSGRYLDALGCRPGVVC